MVQFHDLTVLHTKQWLVPNGKVSHESLHCGFSSLRILFINKITNLKMCFIEKDIFFSKVFGMVLNPLDVLQVPTTLVPLLFVPSCTLYAFKGKSFRKMRHLVDSVTPIYCERRLMDISNASVTLSLTKPIMLFGMMTDATLSLIFTKPVFWNFPIILAIYNIY